MMPYERFQAWQLSHQLALEVYRITDGWPKEERFGVTIQLRRAALSAPTNIAEVIRYRRSVVPPYRRSTVPPSVLNPAAS
jgi:hypothetical protein